MKKNNMKRLALFVGACMLSMLFTSSFVAPVKAADIIYVDAPTGNYWEDHPNIENALNAIAPGGTVVLAEGTYAIHKALVTEGFHGTIIGAGMDVTYIEAVRGDSGYFERTHMSAYDGWYGPGSEDHFTALLYFGSPETSLAVSDLTLEVNEPDIAEDSYTYYPASGGEPEFYDWWGTGNNIASGIEIATFTDCDTSFENVRMKGLYTLIMPTDDNPYGGADVSPQTGLGLWWSSGGTHLVKDCVFESFGAFQCGLYGLDSAECVFESNTVTDGFRGFVTAFCAGLDVRVRNNYFQDIDCQVIANFWLDGSMMKVSHNKMVNVEGGFWYNHNWRVTEGSRYLVEHNYIELKQYCWSGGIEVWESTDAKSELVVVNNRIHSIDATAPYGPISLNGVVDSVVAFNKITGRGVAAMYIGAAWNTADDVSIIGNNVQNFEVTGGYWDLPIYHPWAEDPIEGEGRIWLGELSRNCLVVGGCNKKNVVNQGTDNIVVGVDRIGWRKLGQLVSATMKQIWDMKRAFR
ncbi:MAG: hypothetical protein ACFFAX_12565 [Promethearchaeota archaeon]